MGKLLITGGAGFIGTALAKKAVETGWTVRVLDLVENAQFDSNGSHKLEGIESIQGDIRNRELMEKTIAGCDAVVHLAAQVSVPLSVSNPNETMDINVEGTEGLIELCHEFKIERLIIASSAAVYGNAENIPLKEQAAGQTLSPYALSKWTNEAQILQARKNGLQAAALRFFNVYGPGQKVGKSYAAVIPKFIEQMVSGISPQINGDGLQTRDFVHVTDVVAAILTMLEGSWKAEKNHVFNVATQKEITLNKLVDVINQAILNIQPDHEMVVPQYGPPREGDIRHSVANIDRINATFGWKPNVVFQDGISEMVQEKISKGV